jgi:hypothetical protein
VCSDVSGLVTPLGAPGAQRITAVALETLKQQGRQRGYAHELHGRNYCPKPQISFVNSREEFSAVLLQRTGGHAVREHHFNLDDVVRVPICYREKK